jgi:hypothetical protein
MPPGAAPQRMKIFPLRKGDSVSVRDREGDVSVGCARGSCDRDTPQRLRRFSPPLITLIGGIFRRATKGMWDHQEKGRPE